MENGSKCRELIRTRYVDLTHDIDLDGTRFAEGNHQLAALITRAIGGFDTASSFVDGQSCQLDWTVILEGDHAFSRDGLLNLQLAGTIDINDYLITCA